MSLFRTLRYIVNHPLNKGRSAHAIFHFLRWQIGSRLSPGEIVYSWVDGTRVIVRPGETGFTSNIYCGLYEFSDMAYILHVLDSEDVFVDVGANVGAYTLLACGVRGARGYCFEPIGSTYERLRDNINLNALSDRVSAFHCGVSDEEGELRFTSGEGATNHVLASGERGDDVVSVPVVTLDSVLLAESPSVLKVDVEGFETKVLRGATELLEKESLHSIILELNGSGQRYGFSDDDAIGVISQHGFLPFSYDPFTRTLSRDRASGFDTGNTIFVRHVESVGEKLRTAPIVRVGNTSF